MAGPSTITALILGLIAEGCWTRRQLRCGIKDVSVALELMNSLTIIRVVFKGTTFALPELDFRFLHAHPSNPGSDFVRLLGSTPATWRYQVRPEMPIPHGAIGFHEGEWHRAPAGDAGFRLQVASGCEFSCLLEQLKPSCSKFNCLTERNLL